MITSVRVFPSVCMSALPVFLDDQPQVDSKPAGQPKQGSLNQCQQIAANSPQFVLYACPTDCGDKLIRFLCNVIDTRARIGPWSNVTSRWCLNCDTWHESSSSL